MCQDDKLLLKQIAKQLEAWASESVTGGWSTHQVKPMRDLASQIYCYIGGANYGA